MLFCNYFLSRLNSAVIMIIHMKLFTVFFVLCFVSSLLYFFLFYFIVGGLMEVCFVYIYDEFVLINSPEGGN